MRQNLLRISAAMLLMGLRVLLGAQTPSNTSDYIQLSKAAVPASDRVILAGSTTDYPVTPGDLYGLSYLTSIVSMSIQVFVEDDYSLDLGIFGEIATKGMTLPSLRKSVERLVENAYPGSHARFEFLRTGLFSVLIKGEVDGAYTATAWGLSRLSEVLDGHLREYSSTRNVTVTAADGRSRSYDLFLAGRTGDLGNDPRVKKGDVVTVRRAPKVVTIEGEVRRPGTYALRQSDNLDALLETYADGMLSGANGDAVTITRVSSDDVELIEIDLTYPSGRTRTLTDQDVVTVFSKSDFLPVVYIDGAIVPGIRIRHPLRDGDTLYTVLRQYEDRITPDADLTRGYIYRPGQKETIAVDLERILHQADRNGDIRLKAQDSIIIPFGLLEVYVGGEVEQSEWVTMDSLSRLSTLIEERASSYASLRDVRVTSADGTVESYDLFRASRFGESLEDPFLKPGDRVAVGRAAKVVTIEGEVKRPGTYALLEADDLEDLLTTYADGTLPGANGNSVTITRVSSDGVELIEVDTSTKGGGRTSLTEGDVVAVFSKSDFLAVVYLDGAIVPGIRIRHPLRNGDTLYTVLREYEDRITPDADLTRGYIVRPGQEETIAVDLERILHQADRAKDIQLRPGDSIVIPFGLLEVYMSGEVARSEWVTLDSLSRLKPLIDGRTTRYSSLRDIRVTSADGTSRTYDLFRASRFGETDQDPYLKPGDRVTVGRAARRVTVAGEVERPGLYQLLEGERLSDLIDYYGGGTTILANTKSLEITRYQLDDDAPGRMLYVDMSDSDAGGYDLMDLDRVLIRSKLSYLPSVTLEGAVSQGESLEAGVNLEASNQIRYVFKDGEMLSSALYNLRSRFTQVADLQYAYVIRTDGSSVAINMHDMLYRNDKSEDVALQENDRIVVPFRQYFVIVSGAVLIPGRYPYIPDRTYDYYVNLAGGFDPDKHAGTAVTVIDINGEKVTNGRVIEPETRISAPNNNPFYVIGKIAAIVGAISSLTAVVLTIIGL